MVGATLAVALGHVIALALLVIALGHVIALPHVVVLALLAVALPQASHVRHLDRGPLRVQQLSRVALTHVEVLP